MLTYRPLPDFEGITLIGSYLDLKQLYGLLHEVNQRSPLQTDKEGGVLPLAYDVRKAFSGDRDVISPPESTPEIGTRFGVAQLWPLLLVHVRMLRASLAYMDHNARDQAITYDLEAVLHEAIDEVFGAEGSQIREAWELVDPACPLTEQLLDGRAAAFLSWSGSRREASLAPLLASLRPDYEKTKSWEHHGAHLSPARLAAARWA